MNLNRRKMLGVAAGGAIAGPSLVRAAQMPAPMPPSDPYPSSGLSYGAKEADPDWTINRLAELKRKASGDLRDEERDYPTQSPLCPYVPLRSTSESARRFMRDRREEKKWRERTIKAALGALDHYDKTGILRTFF